MTHLRRIAGLALVLLLAGVAGADAQTTSSSNREVQRFTLPGGNTTGWRLHTDGTRLNLTLPVGATIFTGSTFANLPNFATTGAVIYCTDCNKATPCSSGGTGALAKRLGSNTWDCD